MIRRMDVNKLFTILEQESISRFPVTASVAAMTCSYVACLVVATDGIWDNWSYEDVTKFVMDDSCTKAVLQTPPSKWGSSMPSCDVEVDSGAAPQSPPVSGTQRVANSLIKRNAVFAKRNFGGDADNATGVVVYLADPRTGSSVGGPFSP